MQRFRFILLNIMVLSMVISLSAQDYQFETRTDRFTPIGSITVSEVTDDWQFRLNQFTSVTQGNRTYRQHLLQLKQDIEARFPRQEITDTRGARKVMGTSAIDDPEILRSFKGNLFSNSAPNDNTLAVSNDGQLISAINTNIYFYDLKKDSLMKTMSLNAFSAPLTGISQHQYDPKLLYDPHQNRFVIVFLAGASSDTKTDIVVGFSETSDMLGAWHIYSLPGNPLNDTSWTDYPAIALTEDELFITVNLLNYGTSWQTSFKQTIVWQVDKRDGYLGQTLDSRLWNNITFDGVNLRNLNPIQGAHALTGPNMYLLSNRNFTTYSDSVFLVEITGNLENPNTTLQIQSLHPEVGYGAPPDARQPNTLKRLATNDARVLGGFLHANTIQFVANSIDTMTGGAAIYHGIIRNVTGNPTIEGRIISEPGLEFGYPNIANTGNTLFSQQAIIGFNHTGDTVLPGVSAIFYDGAGGYSNRVEIKKGEFIISIFSGTYERWGDYTGIQRVYNEPGKVWISGMYGYKIGLARRLGTHIAELVSSVAEKPMVLEGHKLTASLYPNPTTDYFAMEFTLETQKELIIELRSLTGQQIHRFFEGSAPAGKNALMFSTANLAQGAHVLWITDAKGELLFSEKVLKLAH
jgi:hypothetical protein